MSIPFFHDVLKTLGKKVNYDAVVNYAGNSFAKDSWKMIQDANPLLKENSRANALVGFVSKAPIMDDKMKEEIAWAM